MAKIKVDKELQKQRDERNIALRKVDMGLIAVDVLMNKKTEYTKAFLQSMSEADNMKIKIVDEIFDEIRKQLNEFDEKFMFGEE